MLKLNKNGEINPMLSLCPCCHKEKNEIFLTGIAGDKIKKEDPYATHLFGDICEECDEVLANGGVWIKEVGPYDSWTGNGIRLKENAAKQILDPTFYSSVQTSRGICLARPEDFAEIEAILKAI